MLSYPCTTCYRPAAIGAIHTWLYGHPFCSADCLQRGIATGRYDTVPDLKESVTGAATLMAETMRLVLAAIPNAEAAAEQERTANSPFVKGIATNMAAGGLFAALAGAAIEGTAAARASGSVESQDSQLGEINRRLHDVVRQMMIFHGAGYAVAPLLMPIVEDSAAVGRANARSAKQALEQLYSHLVPLNDGVRALRVQLLGADAF